MQIPKQEILRKIIHASMASFIIFYELSPEFTILLGIISCIGYAFSEAFRHLGIKLTLIHKLIETCKRPEENYIFTPFLLLFSLVFAFLFFEKVVAYAAILSATLGDSLATIAGKIFGKIRIYKTKTLEGSLALFLTTFLSSFSLLKSLSIALFAATIATIVELFSGDFDNLSVPLSIALGIELTR